MKIILIIFSVFFLKTLASQTSSNQLGSLIRRIDSLTNLLETERNANQTRIFEIKKQLNEKENQLQLIQRQYGINKVESTPLLTDLNKTYVSVSIGKQIWMKENLNVTFFRNGDPIPEAKSKEEWIAAGKQNKPAWCSYDNDAKNDVKYGKLYNWFAVSDPRGLAPHGWKIPEFEDLNLLDTYLWGDVGKKLKNESGWNSWNVEERCKACIGWTDDQQSSKKCLSCNNKGVRISKSNIGNGTNSSGFSALPGGFRNSISEFEKIGQQCNLWSSTPQYTLYGRYRTLINMENELLMNYATKDLGMSVRCLKE